MIHSRRKIRRGLRLPIEPIDLETPMSDKPTTTEPSLKLEAAPVASRIADALTDEVAQTDIKVGSEGPGGGPRVMGP